LALKEFEDQLRAETGNEQRASVIAAKAKEDATVAATPIVKGKGKLPAGK
jgi:hypothetical protein